MYVHVQPHTHIPAHLVHAPPPWEEIGPIDPIYNGGLILKQRQAEGSTENTMCLTTLL